MAPNVLYLHCKAPAWEIAYMYVSALPTKTTPLVLHAGAAVMAPPVL